MWLVFKNLLKTRTNDGRVQRIFDLITGSQKVVALTGAGVSTPSGIPDFRSPSSGLWEIIDPGVFTADYFKQSPREFYEIGRRFIRPTLMAIPNEVHKLLAKLEQKKLIAGLVTQNIDGLHQKAGSRRVFELHGNLRQAVCVDCRSVVPIEKVTQLLDQGQFPPLCARCGGVLKIDVILFGDPMPIDFSAAMDFVKDADLFLVMGTSLSVYPANLIPERAVDGFARMIIINREKTSFDHIADVVVNEDLIEFSRKLATLLY
jgi:NAD-dependent deacetylase